MEIGTYKGETAERLIRAAQSNHDQVEYYGFDLFARVPANEFFPTSKDVPTLEEVKTRLDRTGAKIRLFKGDTRETLPSLVEKLPKMDFIFIDGGHSEETVRSDWENSRRLMHDRTLVVFDDMGLFGVTKVVESIDKNHFAVNVICHKGEAAGLAIVTNSSLEI